MSTSDTSLLPRAEAMAAVHLALANAVDDLGPGAVARELGISTDTIRRRVRGQQPWQWTEVLDLARLELKQKGTGEVARILGSVLNPEPRGERRPLLMPTNLRQVLRLVGKLTSEIADALEDGRVDVAEARRLLLLFAELTALAQSLRPTLEGLIADSAARAQAGRPGPSTPLPR